MSVTPESDSIEKLRDEHDSVIPLRKKVLLKIKLRPGMEMLAQELRTGEQIYEPDSISPQMPASPLPSLEDGSASLAPSKIAPSPMPYEYGQSPVSPFFPPLSPAAMPLILRLRSGHYKADGTGSYPTLIIERDRVKFYSDAAGFEQFLGEMKPDLILINTKHVIAIQQIIAYEVASQNRSFDDIRGGVATVIPDIVLEEFKLEVPLVFPQVISPDDEIALQIKPQGGQPPYDYMLLSGPSDLFVTEDGWLRGFIDATEFPLPGATREFLIRIAVEDSSIPTQTAILDYRYRLVG